MRIFGTTKANKRRRLNDLLKIAHSLPEYRSLARIVGHKTADSALTMTYVIESNLAQGDATRLSKDMKLTLQKEINDVLAGHYDDPEGRKPARAAQRLFLRSVVNSAAFLALFLIEAPRVGREER
jgi:hypothetical protein